MVFFCREALLTGTSLTLTAWSPSICLPPSLLYCLSSSSSLRSWDCSPFNRRHLFWASSFGHLLGPNSPVESIRNRFLWGIGLRNWFSPCIVKFWSLEGAQREENRVTAEYPGSHTGPLYSCIQLNMEQYTSCTQTHTTGHFRNVKFTVRNIVCVVQSNMKTCVYNSHSKFFICFLICAFYKTDSQFICHLNQLDLNSIYANLTNLFKNMYICENVQDSNLWL